MSNQRCHLPLRKKPENFLRTKAPYVANAMYKIRWKNAYNHYLLTISDQTHGIFFFFLMLQNHKSGANESWKYILNIFLLITVSVVVS